MKPIKVDLHQTIMTERDLKILNAMVLNLQSFIESAETLAQIKFDDGKFKEIKEVSYRFIIEEK